MKNFIFYGIFALLFMSGEVHAMEERKRKEPEKEEPAQTRPELQQPPIKRRRIISKPTKVKTLKEISKQKFIEVAPEVENLSELLASIPAEELRQQIKAEFQKRLPFEETRLHNARSEQEIENLLILGVNPNLQDRSAKTALNALIDKGHLDAAFHLVSIAHEAIPYQNIPLEKLEKDESIKPIIKALLIATQGNGLDVSTPDVYKVTPLQRAIQHEDLELAVEIIEILKQQQKIDSIYDVNLADMTALTLAILYLPQLITTFKELGIDLTIKDEAGNPSLLFLAVKNDKADAIKYLINAGIDINEKNNDGISALMGAASNNSPLIKLLLENGADPNAMNNNGGTVLMFARLHPEVIKLLLDAGAQINKQDIFGNTTLIHAIVDNIESAKLLINAGANIALEDQEGKTALFIAATENPSAIEPLIKAGADPNKPNSKGKLPLFTAAKRGALEGVKKLLEFGANPNKKSRTSSMQFKTPLEIAII